ncbi:DUF6098 family protein [Microbacterium yannicii]|uniref:DUF6098 family protein n=1 Tax=Microbacterium yannicii TaxID=671622 RepID=UPI00031A1390|nr:DUF6098 family protein [Microbacterium yannicii]
MEGMPLLRSVRLDTSVRTLEELAGLVSELGVAYVRYSEGPERDDRPSIDTESGLELPGLSVNPLHAERWWDRPFEDWLARQVCQYNELQAKNPARFPWVLRGEEVGRGPDCEPLLRDVVPVARIDDALLREATQRYQERFDAGKGPED